MVEQFGLVTMAPFQPLRLLLFGHEGQMVGVDLRDEQRHERIHPVVAGVADDEVPGGGKGLLDVAGDRRVERREHDARTASRDDTASTVVSASESGIGAASRHGATAA